MSRAALLCAAILVACGAPRAALSPERASVTPVTSLEPAPEVPAAAPAPEVAPPPEPPPEPPAITLEWPSPDARFATTEEIALFWRGGGDARVCADERCETVLGEDVPFGGGVPRAPPGPVYWSVVVDGRATPAQRFWIGATGPSFDPLASTFEGVGESEGAAARVRFVRGDEAWTARVHTCETAEYASRDPGCGVLVLQRGDEARFMPIDRSYHVHQPQLLAIHRPGGGEGLLVLEARGLAQHTDVWHVHLVEDDGGGPRPVLHAVVDVCGWGDAGAECPPLQLRRLRPSYRDVDRDGDLDLALGRGRGRYSFRREVSGRFDFAAEFVDPALAPPRPEDL